MRDREEKYQKFYNKDNSRKPPSEDREETVPATVNGIVSNSLYVKIRSKPEYSRGNVIATLKKDSSIKIIGDVSDFYKIIFDEDRKGYISKHYCTKEGEDG